jgi:hypothetical protein
MQVQVQNDTETIRVPKDRLADRQARVGIIANLVDVPCPVVPARDVWTRWPNLQSARRKKQRVALRPDQTDMKDAVLSGEMLAVFAKEIRTESHGRGPAEKFLRYDRAVLANMTAAGVGGWRKRGARAFALAAFGGVALGLGAVWWLLG